MNGSSSGQVNGTPGTQMSMEQGELSQATNNNETLINTMMPNYDGAITPREKFLDYSLNYNNPNARGKAEAYERALGYTKNNADSLIRQIHSAITNGAKPYNVSQSQFGTKYKFRITVTGLNGCTKNVIAVYQLDSGSNVPRMITNYVEEKK